MIYEQLLDISFGKMYNIIIFRINLQDDNKLSMCSVHNIMYKFYINCNYSNHNNITGQCLVGVYRTSSFAEGGGRNQREMGIPKKNISCNMFVIHIFA